MEELSAPKAMTERDKNPLDIALFPPVSAAAFCAVPLCCQKSKQLFAAVITVVIQPTAGNFSGFFCEVRTMTKSDVLAEKVCGGGYM